METCGFWVRLRIILLGLLGGSWVVIGRVVSRPTFLLAHNRGLRTPLITTHEPPSRLGTIGVWDHADGQTQKAISRFAPWF